MIKLVFIMSFDLEPRYLQQFCLDSLANSFSLEYWDCSRIVRPVVVSSMVKFRGYVRHIESIGMFKTMLKRLPKDSIIMNGLGPWGGQEHLQIQIARYFPSVTFIYFNKFAKEIQHSRFVDRAPMNVNSSVVKDVWHLKIKHFLYQNDYIYIIAKYFRYMGDKRFEECVKQRRRQKISLMNWLYIGNTMGYNEYPIPHPDLEFVRKSANYSQGEETPYVLFVDENFPLHPSLLMLDIDKNSLAQQYYESMNLLFDKIETVYGCDVVIGAHPTANYSSGTFKNRKIIYGKTNELIKSCKYVLVHATELMNVIAYFDKPVAFVTNNIIDSVTDNECFSSMRENIRMQAKALDQNVYNIDEIDNDNISNMFHKLTPDRREEYVVKYLGDTMQTIDLADIYKMHFLNIYNRLYKNHNNV